VWKLAVVVMISGPIESEWMMIILWMVCLNIRIGAALTVCSSAKVIGVWFGILPLISSSFSLMKQVQAVVSLSWELASV